MTVNHEDIIIVNNKIFNELLNIFDNIFNEYIVESNTNLYLYNTFIKGCNKNFNNIKYNPNILLHLKSRKNIENYDTINFHLLTTDFQNFIFNVIKYNKYEDVINSKLLETFKLTKYYGNYNYQNNTFYKMTIVFDIRLSYKFDGKLIYIYNLIDNPYFIENIYYINRINIIDDKYKNELIKNMKVKNDMNDSQFALFKEFVCYDKFSKLLDILNILKIKYYITGSVIDYMNNTNLNKDLYNDSDIDIVITDKSKILYLAGYLDAKYNNTINMTYTHDKIDIEDTELFGRPVQIYYSNCKEIVFTHHFPCVRGYVNNKFKLALSHQAIDIFRPESDKLIRYVFMFPYTDKEKCINLFKKYMARGYKFDLKKLCNFKFK